jgi:multidrug resistance efflux pump
MTVSGNALMSIDREKLLQQLARVMNQMAECEETVARHRKAVAELESDGRQASLAHKMLKYAEHVQTIHLAEQRRLEKMLGEQTNGREKIEV